MDIKLLVKITSRAWALDIMAQMHRGVPGRQAALIAASGAGRTAFGVSLAHLMELGLVARNPGHGHPLRPEFVLTDLGAVAAAKADEILQAAEESDTKLLRKSWTVPVLALAAQPQRFSGLKARLGAITDRALSTSLQTLEAQDWVTREIDLSERVPFPTYQAVNAGERINQVIGLAA
ncbi:MAG: winged helix-turn-helix transcriptional regulator [Shimia sp.]